MSQTLIWTLYVQFQVVCGTFETISSSLKLTLLGNGNCLTLATYYIQTKPLAWRTVMTKQIGMRFPWNAVQMRETCCSVKLTTGKQATLLCKKNFSLQCCGYREWMSSVKNQNYKEKSSSTQITKQLNAFLYLFLKKYLFFEIIIQSYNFLLPCLPSKHSHIALLVLF